MNNAIITLSSIFVIFCTISAYILIKTPSSYKIKFLLIPAILWMGYYSTTEIPNVFGRPKEGYPEQEFRLIAFTSVSRGDDQYIELWSVEKKDKETRLYIFPYDEDVKQQLQKLAEGNAKGHPGTGKFKKGKLKSSSDKKESGGEGKKGNSKQRGMNNTGDKMDLEIKEVPGTILPSKSED